MLNRAYQGNYVDANSSSRLAECTRKSASFPSSPDLVLRFLQVWLRFLQPVGAPERISVQKTAVIQLAAQGGRGAKGVPLVEQGVDFLFGIRQHRTEKYA